MATSSSSLKCKASAEECGDFLPATKRSLQHDELAAKQADDEEMHAITARLKNQTISEGDELSRWAAQADVSDEREDGLQQQGESGEISRRVAQADVEVPQTRRNMDLTVEAEDYDGSVDEGDDYGDEYDGEDEKAEDEYEEKVREDDEDEDEVARYDSKYAWMSSQNSGERCAPPSPRAFDLPPRLSSSHLEEPAGQSVMNTTEADVSEEQDDEGQSDEEKIDQDKLAEELHRTSLNEV